MKKIQAMEPWQRSSLATDHIGYRLSLMRGQLPARPSTLWIEVTNRCNLHCLMCDRDSLTRPQADIEWSMFEKIADEAIKLGVRRIKLNRYGECLMHPKIHEMTKYLKSRGVPWVFFVSNGTLMNEDRRKAIVDSGLDLLVVSIDGYTAETYETIRRGARLDKVRTNVEELIRLRNESGKKRPLVQINTVLMQDNADEVPDLIRYWEDRADLVSVRSYGVTGTLGDRSVLAEEHFDNELSPCHFIYSSMLTFVNGDVTICCADFNGALVIGNVTKQSLADMWRGAAYEKIRELMKGGRFNELPPICRTCLAAQKNKLKALNRQNHEMYRAAAARRAHS